MDWQMVREVVAPIVAVVGGLVGLIGGSLSIYYNSTSTRILLKRFRREEEAKLVDARADDFMRRAHEAAVSKGGSMMQFVPLELVDDFDRKAAWKLCKDGHGTMKGQHIWVSVDLMPPMISRDMARRAAMRVTDNFH
jgi:hypothetical protein